MLKHLPEGLVPFEDCGFARHPFAPLAMEPVRVDCRVDAEDGQPVLRLRVDGGPESEIALQLSPVSCRMISVIRRPVSPSMPLVALTNKASFSR